MQSSIRSLASRRIVLAIVLGLATAVSAGPGCGSGDGSGRLAQGASARAYSADGKSVRIFFAEKVERISEGTRVDVLDDGERGELGARRKVVVAIQGGPLRGMAGQMERGRPPGRLIVGRRLLEAQAEGAGNSIPM